MHSHSKLIGKISNDIKIKKWTYNENKIYALIDKNEILQFSIPKLELINSIKVKDFPSALYCDEMYLYIGFIDGSIEVRDFKNLEEVKSVDVTDLRGPGRKTITQISSTHHHMLTNSEENGVIIFRKPTILSYKWILIDGETEFTAFSIRNKHVFVLTKLGEVHFLDFEVQKLIEIDPFILSLNYIDLEYDGRYLYLATDKLIKIYDRSDSFSLVSTVKSENKIQRLFIVDDNIIVIQRNGNLCKLEDFSKLLALEMKISENNYTSEIWKYKSQNFGRNKVFYELNQDLELFEIHINNLIDKS